MLTLASIDLGLGTAINELSVLIILAPFLEVILFSCVAEFTVDPLGHANLKRSSIIVES
jgi:hypothetical protein